MNRRYIDFVPAKKGSTAKAKVPVRPRAAVVTRTTVTKTTVTGVSARPAPVRPVNARSVNARPTEVTRVVPAERKLPTEKKPALGVIEDLNTHFVKTDVPKRPLSEKPVNARAQAAGVKTQAAGAKAQAAGAKAQAAEAKQQKVKARVLKSAAKKPASTPVKPVEKSTYKPPKSPFINQNKVVKRPLSGNIYRKEIVEAVKEEPKGPVTIIAKPEKDRHIGIVVTIIITIILGAAAGTVAFLLLPK